jgi:hypothetical protein
MALIELNGKTVDDHGPCSAVRYFLLRIVAGLLFVQTGGLILFGWFGEIPRQPGTSPLMSQTGIGGGA